MSANADDENSQDCSFVVESEPTFGHCPSKCIDIQIFFGQKFIVVVFSLSQILPDVVRIDDFWTRYIVEGGGLKCAIFFDETTPWKLGCTDERMHSDWKLVISSKTFERTLLINMDSK
jgi:hypothetical protein